MNFAGPFERRIDAMKNLNLPPHCKVIDMEECSSPTQVTARLEKQISSNTTDLGLMLRRPGSFVEVVRSPSLLRVLPKVEKNQLENIDRFFQGFLQLDARVLKYAQS